MMRKINLHPNDLFQCKEHGVMGVLPCPWPGCSNGVDDDCFQQALMLPSAEGTIYNRREWRDANGGCYFSWESSRLSNWFYVEQVFWNEARRRKLANYERKEIVYHYTTVNGLMGILESKSIWLSDYSYLNDRQEMLHGANLASSAIDKLLLVDELLPAYVMLKEWKSSLELLSRRVCVASFSGNGDSLAQWRAYGQVALGIDTYSIGLHVDQSRFNKVEYDESIQRQLVDLFLGHAAAACTRDLERKVGSKVEDLYRNADRFIELIAFFKDPAFVAEDEYRLAYVDKPEIYGELGFDPVPKSFRVAGGRIVPYVSSVDILRSEQRKYQLEFKELVLGPECDDLFERGIKEYLIAKGMEAIQVRRTKVPFRG